MKINKYLFSLSLMLLSMSVSAQMERICPTCKKVLSKCSYKGKHPKEAVCPICKKVVSQCAYKGKHPKVVTPTIDKTIVVDGMQYRIKGKEATLIKGKTETSTSIPQTVVNEGNVYPVVGIDSYAFTGCEPDNITTIIIPNGLKIIAARAFDGCKGIKELFIPASVEIIYGQSVSGLVNLERIIVDSNNKVYDSRNNCNAIIHKRTGTLIKGCINTKIPNGVKIIGVESFDHCSITEIAIPLGVERIEGSAFAYCSNLSKVSFPETLKIIKQGAFCECKKLTNISLPNSLKELEQHCFENCGIQKVYIPKNVKRLSSNVVGLKDEGNPFSGCMDLSEIVVDKNNKYYDSREDCNAIIDKRTKKLLSGCYNTKIPDGIVKIGQSAFRGCKKLKTIRLPLSLKSVGRLGFFQCALETIEVPNGSVIPPDEFPKSAKIIRY